MQVIIQLNEVMLISSISWQFVSKSLMVVLLTFFFFFLLMRTLEKENIYKFDIKNLYKRLRFIKYSTAVLLVKDGVLQLDKLHVANITPQQIYEAMRSKKINHLSQVERLFLVPGGDFSIYASENLPVEIPVQYLAKELPDRQGKA